MQCHRENGKGKEGMTEFQNYGKRDLCSTQHDDYSQQYWILYLKVAKKIDPRSSHHQKKKKKKINSVW